jgi:hypothetical protein
MKMVLKFYSRAKPFFPRNAGLARFKSRNDFPTCMSFITRLSSAVRHGHFMGAVSSKFMKVCGALLKSSTDWIA